MIEHNVRLLNRAQPLPPAKTSAKILYLIECVCAYGLKLTDTEWKIIIYKHLITHGFL
ncbi:hypothetical protein LEP1GSC058_0927 [Leptospira fainei serovar Hurstbridge str. BUT 6]|uniref:Uncharacterized protein n=1 Tax=Leptospira fainei serovar Hurstbridge str. BUT 6 TaxID=1193011 RepID=S3UTT6_9LEPT|nr:hypothetical protein LEP1GSC058_0927 [Leptospira fainei serovar Hurstbridge str. BUT 6]